MCSCSTDVKIQEYQNQVLLELPVYMKKYYNGSKSIHISIDSCLKYEIEKLWGLGIKTTGCCCGHNMKLPYIGVDESDVDKMLSLGYNIQLNPNGVDNIKRVDTFYPKTIKYTKDKFIDMINHLESCLAKI